jgi:DNA-binding transcriptional LysR family regulator
MDNIDIRRIDVTLLLVFQELMRTRKMTATAERMKLTQSSISHALKRLREIFADDLFVRLPHGLQPTARAEELQATVDTILESLRSAVSGIDEFDPSRTRATIRISMPDHHCALIGAPLLDDLRKSSPGLQVLIRPLVRRAALDALLGNDIDLALGYFWRVPEGLESRVLFVDGHRVISRKDHPVIKGRKLSLDAYLKPAHVLVSLGGSLEGIVDRALARRNAKRRVVAGIPYFLPAIVAVATTDLISTIPARHAAAFAERFALNVHEPPVELPQYRAVLVWHRRHARSQLIQWFTARLEAVFDLPECGGARKGRAALAR